jgi:hypothetical protein
MMRVNSNDYRYEYLDKNCKNIFDNFLVNAKFISSWIIK